MPEATAPSPTMPTGLKTHEEVIDGILYTTITLTATEGLIILPKLVNLIGQNGMALLMSTTDEQKDNLLGNPEVVSALMASIAERASEDNGLLVIKDLLKSTTCDKVKVGDNFIKGNVSDRFDDHFAGRYMHLMNVAIWVARVTFGGP